MSIVIALLAILGYGLCLNRVAKWSLESSLLFVSASLVCLLYLFGLLGVLQIGSQALLGIGLLLFVTGGYSLFKRRTISQYNSPAILFLLLSTAGLFVLTSTEYYSNLIFVDDFFALGKSFKNYSQ